MKLTKTLIVLAITLLAAAPRGFCFDITITGAAKVQLAGPITPEQMDKCKGEARTKLKAAVLRYLLDQKQIEIETSELLPDLLFNAFVDSCAIHSTEASGFKEGFWTFSYTILPDAIEAALTAYNDRTELLATNSWKRLQNAIGQKNNEEIYYQSVEVIAYATAYLGSLLTVPDDNSKVLIEEARSILKDFLERVSIYSTGQIIEGQPGKVPMLPPSMSVTIDGMPFAGLGMSGYIPGSGGSDVYNGVADNTGVLTFDNIIIPFVKTGTMMYIAPNLGRVINSKWRVGMKDFGLKVKKDLKQSFFFKVTPPVYTLKFSATTTDPTDTLPRDFVSGASTRKFLADSFGMVEASPVQKADLTITITVEAAAANFNLKESCEARFKCFVSIQAPNLTPPKTESESFTLEKAYDKIPDEYAYAGSKNRKKKKSMKDDDESLKIPLGSFTWEANISMRKTIRMVLNRL